MKKTPAILPTYYKSLGTPIFRDTTALPFADGGVMGNNECGPGFWWNPNTKNCEPIITVNDLNDPRYLEYLEKKQLYDYSQLPNFNVKNALINDFSKKYNSIKDPFKINNEYQDFISDAKSDFKYYPDIYNKYLDDTKGPWNSATSKEILSAEEFKKKRQELNIDLNDDPNYLELLKKYAPSKYQILASETRQPYNYYIANSTNNKFKTPETRFLEDEINREELRKVYPNLTDETINRWINNIRESPNYISNQIDPKTGNNVWISSPGKYETTITEDGSSTDWVNTKYLKNDYPLSYIDPDTKVKGYYPESITSSFRKEYSYIPVWDMPTPVEYRENKPPKIVKEEVDPVVPEPDGEYKLESGVQRNIDWNGNRIGFNTPRFRKPGHSGPLIKSGSKHYIHYPSIEKRNYLETIPQESEEINRKEFADGGPLNDRNIKGDLLPSIYASALGNYYGQGGQMQPDYSLPEDSFQQGGRGLKNSVYASSMGQYPATYAAGGPIKPPKFNLNINPYSYNPSNLTGGYEGYGNLGSKDFGLSTTDLLGRNTKRENLRLPFSASLGIPNDKSVVNDTREYMNPVTPEGLPYSSEEILASQTTPYADNKNINANVKLGLEGSGLDTYARKRVKAGVYGEAGYTPTSGMYGKVDGKVNFALGNNYGNPLNRPGEWRAEPYISPFGYQVAQKPGDNFLDDKHQAELVNSLTDTTQGYADNINYKDQQETKDISKSFITRQAGIEGQVKLPLGMLNAGIGATFNRAVGADYRVGQDYRISPNAHIGYTLPLSELSKDNIRMPQINMGNKNAYRGLEEQEDAGTRYSTPEEMEITNEGEGDNLNYAQGGMIKRADGSYSKRGLWDNIRANAGSGKEPTKEMLSQERKINNSYADGGPIYTYDKRPGSYYQRSADGQWLISNKGTDGQYVPVQDPTGQRTAALNKGAVVSMSNPTESKYNNVVPSYGKSPMVQSIAGKTDAERQQVTDDIEGQRFATQMEKDYQNATKNGLPQNEQPLDMLNGIWGGAAALPLALPELGTALASNIPYTGISYGTALNTAGGIHGTMSVPDRVQDWRDVSSGNKTWQEATAKSLGTGLELLGGYSAGKELIPQTYKINPFANNLKDYQEIPIKNQTMNNTESGLFNALPNSEIPQINPRTGLLQVDNTVLLSSPLRTKFKEVNIPSYLSAEGLPEDQIPYLLSKEEVMKRKPWLFQSKDEAIMESFKSHFPSTTRPFEIPANHTTQEDIMARALGKPLPTRVSKESLEPKVYYDLEGNIINPPKNNYSLGGQLNNYYPDGGNLLGENPNIMNSSMPIAAEPITPTNTIPPDNGQATRDFYKNWYSKRTLPFDEIGNKQYEKTMKGILPMYNPESQLINEIDQNKVPYEYPELVEGDPNNAGVLSYNKKGLPEKIQIKQSLLNNPEEMAATQAHEERTRIMDPYSQKLLPAEQMIIQPSIKSFEEGWGNLKGAEADAAGEHYDYLTDPSQDNIQSMLFEIRQRKNLQPNQTITDEDILNWKTEAEQNGSFDKNSPNYDSTLDGLFKVSKDDSSLKNLFNYIASNKTNSLPSYNNPYAPQAGNFG